ncbi:MAG: insulinase family protein, partial [Cyanobacteria bacterium P01_H01_bin.130]
FGRFYRPDNAVLPLVGNFAEDQGFALVRRLFGDIEPGGIEPGAGELEGEGEASLPQGSLAVNGSGVFPRILGEIAQGGEVLAALGYGGGQEAVAGSQSSDAVEESMTGQGTVASPLRLRGTGGVPLIQMVYPMPEAGHPDEAALLVLSRVLATGRRSRLNQQLVEGGTPMAGLVDGLLFQGVDQGWYQLVVEALPDQDLQGLQQQVLATVDQLRSRSIAFHELQRAMGLVRSQLLLEGRDVTSQGMQLGQDCLIVADCGHRDRKLAAVEQVTVEQVQRVAREYLAADRVTVGWLERGAESAADEGEGAWDRRSRLHRAYHQGFGLAEGELEPGTEDGATDGATVEALVQKYLPMVGAPQDALAIKPDVVTLPNGLQVLLVRDASTPTVTVSGYVPAGRQWDPTDRAGLAELVASSLWAGSGDRSEAELTQTLESQGINLNLQTHREGVVISGQALAEQEQDVIRFLGDLLQNPQFDSAALERDRQRALTTLMTRLDSPGYVAR